VASGTVVVADTVPPSLTVTPDQGTLWPPNHHPRTVTLGWQVSDACDPAPVVTLLSVASSEADEAAGLEDGDTTGDIAGAQIGAADTSILLRAERSRSGGGRDYTIAGRATDASGRAATAGATVSVPLVSGGGPEPLLLRLQPGPTAGTVRLDWDAVAGAIGYDVIAADRSAAAVVDHVLTLGTVRVLARGTTALTVTEAAGTATPATGTAHLYFAQPRFPSGGAGYGTESAPWPRLPTSCPGGCP
jgi:hypothetical protein